MATVTTTTETTTAYEGRTARVELPSTFTPTGATGYVKEKKHKTTRHVDNLVSSQQMLLDNIRHLKSEVEQTNREIRRSRAERLYGDLYREELREERDMPYSSRFYRPKAELDRDREETLRAQVNAAAKA